MVPLETGGRFSPETLSFLRQLALARARASPSFLQEAAAHAFQRRWARLLSVAAASAFAASLLLERGALAAEPALDGEEPWLGDVLSEARFDFPSKPSRMPMRS